jgi:uncharacterized protein
MENAKSVLIAGGTGFIGQKLVVHLLKLGYNVKVLTRNPYKAYSILPPETQIIKWPGQNEKILLPKNQNCHAFINLTGENIGKKPWSDRQKAKLAQSRVESVNMLAGLIKQMESAPKVWIQASGIGYYGANPNMVCNERSPMGTGFLAELSHQTEQHAIALKMPNTRLVILRLGVVIHPAGGLLKKLVTPVLPYVVACPGKGNNNLSWVHMVDLLRVMDTCLTDTNFKGVINATAPSTITPAKIFTLLKQTNKKMLVANVPKIIIKTVLGQQMANELVFANQTVDPQFLTTHSFGFVYPEFVPEMFHISPV